MSLLSVLAKKSTSGAPPEIIEVMLRHSRLYRNGAELRVVTMSEVVGHALRAFFGREGLSCLSAKYPGLDSVSVYVFSTDIEIGMSEMALIDVLARPEVKHIMEGLGASIRSVVPIKKRRKR